MSDSSQPHGPQHARLPCLSPSPEICPNSCPLHRWCHPTISSSVVLFSCWLQSSPIVLLYFLLTWEHLKTLIESYEEENLMEEWKARWKKKGVDLLRGGRAVRNTLLVSFSCHQSDPAENQLGLDIPLVIIWVILPSSLLSPTQVGVKTHSHSTCFDFIEGLPHGEPQRRKAF